MTNLEILQSLRDLVLSPYEGKEDYSNNGKLTLVNELLAAQSPQLLLLALRAAHRNGERQSARRLSDRAHNIIQNMDAADFAEDELLKHFAGEKGVNDAS